MYLTEEITAQSFLAVSQRTKHVGSRRMGLVLGSRAPFKGSDVWSPVLYVAFNSLATACSLIVAAK